MQKSSTSQKVSTNLSLSLYLGDREDSFYRKS